jgi:hypothetical protein
VSGYILDGHVTGQIQDTSSKLPDEAPVFLSKADSYLADGIASVAFHPLNLQLDNDAFQGKSRSSKSPPDGTSLDDLARPATGTSKRAGVLLDGKNDRPSYVISLAIPVAHDVENVVQQAGGHALPSFRVSVNSRKDQACPLSVFNCTYGNTG